MKFNRQEAQRSRPSSLSEVHPAGRSVGSPQSTTAPAPTPRHWWSDRRKELERWFAAPSEPTIATMTDAAGQTWWRAYNPQTHELKWLDSETEARLWVDNQPYP